MVAAAGGAPAVSTRTPGRALARASSGAPAMLISTVGAAQSIVTCSSLMVSKMVAGSILRRQMCLAPAAVTVQTNVQPLAWNIGRVQGYVSAGDMGAWISVPTVFMYALRWVIMTPLGREVVPLV